MTTTAPNGVRTTKFEVDSPGFRGIPGRGPFALDDARAYGEWRARKLADHPTSIEEIIVDVADPARPSATELGALARAVGRCNAAIYRTAPDLDEAASRRAVSGLARACGLTRFESHRSAGADGIVAIRVSDEPRQVGFIPYTPRPIGWHTDGYYAWDGPDRAIDAMVLHCVRPAAEGGVNALLDPDIAYIRLRDRDPALIAALMHPAAMSIPPCEEEDGSVRPETVGPVFFMDAASGRICLRYTARKRHVAWRDDAVTRAAAAALTEIMVDDPLIFRARLSSGMGVLCNNVLHDRTGFVDSPGSGEGRLLLRLRSYDRLTFDTANNRGASWPT